MQTSMIIILCTGAFIFFGVILWYFSLFLIAYFRGDFVGKPEGDNESLSKDSRYRYGIELLEKNIKKLLMLWS